MCVAIIKPNGVELPNREVLQRCFMHNSHGGGLATLDKGRRRFKITKGFFDFEVFYKHLKNNVSTEDVAFIHMRIATHGVTKNGKLYAVAEQCHPCFDNIKILNAEILPDDLYSYFDEEDLRG